LLVLLCYRAEENCTDSHVIFWQKNYKVITGEGTHAV